MYSTKDVIHLVREIDETIVTRINDSHFNGEAETHNPTRTSATVSAVTAAVIDHSLIRILTRLVRTTADQVHRSRHLVLNNRVTSTTTVSKVSVINVGVIDIITNFLVLLRGHVAMPLGLSAIFQGYAEGYQRRLCNDVRLIDHAKLISVLYIVTIILFCIIESTVAKKQ